MVYTEWGKGGGGLARGSQYPRVCMQLTMWVSGIGVHARRNKVDGQVNDDPDPHAEGDGRGGGQGVLT